MNTAARIDERTVRRPLLIYPAAFIALGLLLELYPIFAPPVGHARAASDFMAHWLAAHWLAAHWLGHIWPLKEVAQRTFAQQVFGPDHWHLFDSPAFTAVLYAPLGLLPAIPADGAFSLLLLGVAAWRLRPVVPGFSYGQGRPGLLLCAASEPRHSCRLAGR